MSENEEVEEEVVVDEVEDELWWSDFGYRPTEQHCEACGEWLGYNYPALYCEECKPKGSS